jgi:hypothetical protein
MTTPTGPADPTTESTSSYAVTVKWIWLICAMIDVPIVVIQFALEPNVATGAQLGLDGIVYAITIPAAFALTHGRHWALVVLAAIAGWNLGHGVAIVHLVLTDPKVATVGPFLLNVVGTATLAFLFDRDVLKVAKQ